MNTWPERLALTLFLLLGLNVLAITHANSTELPKENHSNLSRDVITECPISGFVRLRLEGTIKNGQLTGNVNNEFVWWSVYSGRVSGFINGHSVMLTLQKERIDEYLLAGWVGSTHIRWSSFGGVFSEYVYCP